MSKWKRGLLMEGGAMRGLFTCGVIDVMMEHGIEYDGAIGVSAGAAFGCNYKSKQIGRPRRYNKRFCRNKEFCSVKSLLKTGDLYGADFCYRKLPYDLDPWDIETYNANPMDFYVVCTDANTGKPVYKNAMDGVTDMNWIRASASMPVASRPVTVEKYQLLDGGISDSIPLKFFESVGYNRIVVLLTQPKGYRKTRLKGLGLVKFLTRDYPKIGEAMEHRPYAYNAQLHYVEEKEKTGEIFVIRPPEALDIGSMEKDPEELERVYQIGRKTMEAQIDELIRWLNADTDFQ